ncbi:MAG TPA: hypothetical protein PKK59_05820 [Anaerolineaceae bacterium]|nr:hypothetical protein [Anaerolineaceae bacterium]
MRCRAEHAYPGRPLEVWDGSCWQNVTEVLEELQTPLGKRYHVVCEGENEFWLVYDPDQDGWQVTAAGETGNKTLKERQ